MSLETPQTENAQPSPEEAEKTKQAREEAARKLVVEKLGSMKWRLSNLYWIEDANGKKVKFRPNWEQREMQANWHNFNVALKCRQPGISTYSAIRMLDFSLFCKNKTSGVIDKTDEDAKKKLSKIKFAYEHLDDPADPETANIGRMVKAAVRLEVDNAKELEWSNGSKIWAGTNMRGGTLQFLWITELGHISFYEPGRAAEIQKGALNTIHKGNTIVVESTHEGGKFGVFYHLVKIAMEAKAPLSPMDWKFHFFPWWRSAQYVLEVDRWYNPDEESLKYFARLKERGVNLTEAQKYWYIKKKEAIGDSMLKEFPSLEEECFEAVIAGSIYGKNVTRLRVAKRISDFEHDRTCPLMTFWDIGYSDFTAIWLLQMVGRDILALAYRCWHREEPPYAVAAVREWEKKYEMPVWWNYLPHDAASKEKSGKSYIDYLREAGMGNTRVVERISDEWLGIQRLRSLLPRFYFHKTDCGKEWIYNGMTMPSGIACLEQYHTKQDASTGFIKETPVHDENSHGASALRTFAEAEMKGLIEGTTALGSGPQNPAGGGRNVIMAGWTPSAGQQRRVVKM